MKSRFTLNRVCLFGRYVDESGGGKESKRENREVTSKSGVIGYVGEICQQVAKDSSELLIKTLNRKSRD